MLKPLPYREVKRKLEAAGIVPHHKEIPIGTLRSILRQAGLTPEEFEQL